MKEYTPSDFNGPFLDIVLEEDLYDAVVVPVAADDPEVVRGIRWLTRTDLPDKVDADFREHLIQQIGIQYGLGSEYASAVFNTCENNLRDEVVDHGE